MGKIQNDVKIPAIEEPERGHPFGNIELDGILALPSTQEKGGIVVFALGSGSGRHSTRNQYVASILDNGFRINTLLVDLLPEKKMWLNGTFIGRLRHHIG
jgi:hypothetical protein